MNIPPARVTIPEEDPPDISADMLSVLRFGRLALGKFTQESESAFADYLGMECAVAVNSGTSALEILLRCLNTRGKEVIVATNTFFATAAAALHAGARVSLIDVEDHMMLDANCLETYLGKGIGAVVLVHIGRNVHPEIKRIRDLCLDSKFL